MEKETPFSNVLFTVSRFVFVLLTYDFDLTEINQYLQISCIVIAQNTAMDESVYVHLQLLTFNGIGVDFALKRFINIYSLLVNRGLRIHWVYILLVSVDMGQMVKFTGCCCVTAW